MVNCKKCNDKFDRPLWKNGKCRVCYETDNYASVLEDAINGLFGN